jgi:hypothetical protein
MTGARTARTADQAEGEAARRWNDARMAERFDDA